MALNLGELTAKLTMKTAEFSRGVNRSIGKLEKLEGAFTKIAVASAAATAALGVVGAKALKAAGDFAETTNVLEIGFGRDAVAGVENWAKKTGEAMGRSTQQMRQFAGDFQLLMGNLTEGNPQAAEMSKTLARLAVDLGSAKNMADPDVFRSLQSAFTGATEPMQKFGVVMTVANLEAFAFAKGITKSFDAMTQAEKTMLRYNFILENTKFAHGDAAKTVGSFNNQLKVFEANAQNAAVSLGNALLPAATEALQKINKIVSNFADLPPEVMAIVGKVGMIAVAVSMIGAAFGGLGLAIPAIAKGIAEMAAITKLIAPFALVAGSIMAIVAGLAVIRDIFPESAKGAKKVSKEAISSAELIKKEIENKYLKGGKDRGGISIEDYVRGQSALARDIDEPELKQHAEKVMQIYLNAIDVIEGRTDSRLISLETSWKSAFSGIKKFLGDIGLSGALSGEVDKMIAEVDKFDEKFKAADFNNAGGMQTGKALKAVEKVKAQEAKLARKLADQTIKEIEAEEKRKIDAINAVTKLQIDAGKEATEARKKQIEEEVKKFRNEYSKAMESIGQRASTFVSKKLFGDSQTGSEAATVDMLGGQLDSLLGGNLSGSSIKRAAIVALGTAVGGFLGSPQIGAQLASMIPSLDPATMIAILGPIAGPLGEGLSFIVDAGNAIKGAFDFAVDAVKSFAKEAVDFVVGLAGRSEGAKDMQSLFDDSMQRLANAFTPFFESFFPLATLFDKLVDVLVPLISAFVNFDFVGAVLFEALKGLSIVVAEIAIAIGRTANLFYALIKSKERVGIQSLVNTLTQLQNLTFNSAKDEAKERARLARTSSDVADSFERLSSSTLNLPAGYRLAAGVFGSQDPLGGIGSGGGSPVIIQGMVVYTADADRFVDTMSKKAMATTGGAYSPFNQWGAKG